MCRPGNRLWQVGFDKSHVQAQPKEGMAGGVGRAASMPELLEVREAKKEEGPQDEEVPSSLQDCRQDVLEGAG